MLIVGIDPGITGAIAAVTPSGRLEWWNDMPIRDSGKRARKAHEIDGAELARLLRPHVPDIAEVWIEEVSAMPGQGVSSMFGLGDSRGCIRGVCEALGLSVQRVHPARWKKHYGLDSHKEASLAAATRLYPTVGAFSRKRDHGRAEAVLVALYGAHQSRLITSALSGYHGIYDVSDLAADVQRELVQQ